MTSVPQDTIRFTLGDDWIVKNDSVKIGCSVSGLVASGTTNEAFTGTVRAILAAFVPDASWEFANQRRARETNGFERVVVIASTRVAETENYNLQERAVQACESHSGYEIANLDVDASMPTSKTKEAESKLRVKLIEVARVEAKTIADAVGLDYRLQNIEFAQSRYDNIGLRAHTKSVETFAASMAYADSAPGGGGDGLGNSQKITMTANVTLARFSLPVE